MNFRRSVSTALLLCLTLAASVPAWGALSWTAATTTAPFASRHDHASVVFLGRLWVIGGLGSIHYNDVWSTTDGVAWIQNTPSAPWTARRGLEAVVHQGRMYVVSGMDGDFANLPPDVWSTADGVNWTQDTANISPMPSRLAYALVSDGSLMHVVGGDQGLSVFGNDLWTSADGAVWASNGTAPWSGRMGYRVIQYEGLWYLFSGYPYQQDVWSSPDLASWSLVTGSPAFTARREHVAAVWDCRMWVMGGEGLTDVWSSTDGSVWTLDSASAPWSSQWGATLTTYQGRMWRIVNQQVYYTDLESTCATPTPSPTAPGTFTATPTPTPTGTLSPSSTDTPVVTPMPTATAVPDPVSLILHADYPNNPNPAQGGGTYIPYWLSKPADLTLTIFTVSGETVVELGSRATVQGWGEVFWDGRNSSGQATASGVYVFRLRARDGVDELHQFGKLAVLR